jgi:transposase
MPGVEVQTVAHALDIHPFMLSRWRKDARDGVLRGRARRVNVPTRSARELKQLQTLKREHVLLKEEHEFAGSPGSGRVSAVSARWADGAG